MKTTEISKIDVDQGKEISEKDNEYWYRKIQPVLGGASLNITLPKPYAISLGLTKDGFVKVSKNDDKIIIEKA
jgi:hypothetical protein